MEELIIKCIIQVLINEGHTEESAKSIVNWNYQDIKSIIETGKC